MSDSFTIVIHGVTETVDVTNFLENMSFDFGVASNWSDGPPTGDTVNDTLYEANISYLAGGAADGVNVVGGGGQVTDSTTGLLIAEPAASIGIEAYLEVDWLPIMNSGEVVVDSGGTLNANGVAIENNYIGSVVIQGLGYIGGILYNSGTIEGGNIIEGGVFANVPAVVGLPTGLIANGTELENLTFEGTLDLTHSGYGNVGFSNVAFDTYAGVYPIVLLGNNGKFVSDGTETLSNLTFDFGTTIGTIESAGSNGAGTSGTLTIDATNTLNLGDAEFYASNDTTIINQASIISTHSTDTVFFAGQSFISGVILPGFSGPVTLLAGLFDNEGDIALSGAKADYNISDFNFINASTGTFAVNGAALIDRQFTSTFENDGLMDISNGGNVVAYDKGFTNDGTIQISVDQNGNTISAGTLTLGTLDIESTFVVTVAPTAYVNNGVIELISTLPINTVTTAAPEFFLGAGPTLSSTGPQTLTNNGTFVLGAGQLALEEVTLIGGTIVGDGGTITGENTIQSSALTGVLNLPGFTELFNDTFAANPFSGSVINAGYDLILQQSSPITAMTINLGGFGAPQVIMGLVSTTLTMDATTTLNANAPLSIIRNWFLANGSPVSTTFVDQGAFNANGQVADIETTNFQNAGQINVQNDAFLNMLGGTATNEASGVITVQTGSELSIGSQDTFTDDGALTLEPGAYLAGQVTLGANVTLQADPGAVLASATIVGGTVIGDSALLASGVLDGVVYEANTVDVDGNVSVEGGTGFIPASGPGPIQIDITSVGADLTFYSPTILNNTIIDLGSTNSSVPGVLGALVAMTLGSTTTIDQTNPYAEINGGTWDNEGSISAGFLNGQFIVAGSLTNDGRITVSNGDEFVIDSGFTENSDGSLMVAAGATLSIQSNFSLAAGASIELAAGSTLIMAGATFNGPSIASPGLLEIGGPDVFQGAPANPVIDLVTDGAGLAFTANMSLNNVSIDLGSPDDANPTAAFISAGFGAIDAMATLASSSTVTQTNRYALLTGGSDDASKLENDGTIYAEHAGGTLTVNSLAGFTNTGDIELQNGEVMNVAPPVINTGLIDDQGTLNFAGSVNGAGTIDLASNASIAFGGPVSAQQVVLNDGLVTIDDPMAFAGSIVNFGSGDLLDLPGETVNDPTYANGKLSFIDSLGGTVTLNVTGNSLPNGPLPSLPDSSGGDAIAGDPIFVWTGGAADGTVSDPNNWNDTTDNEDPAFAPPGSNDTAEFLATGGILNGTGTVDVLQFGGGALWSLASGTTLTAVSGIMAGNGGVAVGAGASLLSTGPFDVISGSGGLGASVSVSGVNGIWNSAGSLIVGAGGIGDLMIQAAGSVASGFGIIANTTSAAGSSVNVTGSGSRFDVTGSLVVGASATGSLGVAAGATVTAATLDAGSAAGSAGIVTISGPGSDLTTTGSFAAGDSGVGEVAILNGATVNIGGDLDIGQLSGGSGVVDIEDSTGTVILGGNINIGLGGGAAEMIVGVSAQVQFENGGETVGKLGRLIQHAAFDPLFLNNAGAVTVFSGTTPYLAFANNTGTVTQDAAGDASVIVSPTLYGSGGTWQVNTGGSELTIGADGVTGQTFAFTDNTGTLVLGYDSLATIDTPSSGTGPFTKSANPHLGLRTIGGFGGTIGGFVAGDTIIVDTSAAAGFSLSGSVVSVLNTVGGATEGSLTFATAGMAQSAMDTPGALVAVMACFAEGTRVRTETGMIAVEDLTVGDRVVTHRGDPEPIIWIGHRSVDCARHPRPETVWPVRVAAGAFGDNVPVRDLYLSPDHAVYINEVLVPVRLLINGTSIARVERATISYYHVELPRHAVILAEGLTVESYLDTGDRTNFQNSSGVMRLFPDFTSRLPADTVRSWEMAGHAELVVSGPKLAAARRMTFVPARTPDVASSATART